MRPLVSIKRSFPGHDKAQDRTYEEENFKEGFMIHDLERWLTLTKLLSFIIFFIEYARLMVTARGKPSGTATTTMVTEKMKNCKGPDAISDTGKPLFSTIHLELRWHHHLL